MSAQVTPRVAQLLEASVKKKGGGEVCECPMDITLNNLTVLEYQCDEVIKVFYSWFVLYRTKGTTIVFLLCVQIVYTVYENSNFGE